MQGESAEADVIMDIHTATKYMQHGYRVRRATWFTKEYLEYRDFTIKKYYVAPPGCSYMYGYAGWTVQIVDLLADDWELITEGIVKDFPLTYADD